MNKPTIKLGRYRHYKGNEYLVEGLACHSETEQWHVVYRPCYGDRELWVRPYEMFVESVEVEGQQLARFAFIGSD